MKLLVCDKCGDTIALSKAVRTCACGAIAGRYEEDGLHAVARGPYHAFGINSTDMALHIRRARMGIHPRAFSPEGRVEAWKFPEEQNRIRTVAEL